MEFSGLFGVVALLAFIAVIGVGAHFAGEGIALVTGTLLLRIFSRGLIRCGERRNLVGPHPKPQSGRVFYVEDAQHFMYRNYVILIGLIFWALAGMAFGYGSTT